MRRGQKGFTLVEIMIVVAIIALLAAIAIPNLLRARMSANDALAQSTLRALSTASETFGTSNNGDYATLMTQMVSAVPSYISVDYCNSTVSGYYYECTQSISAYSFVATPVSVASSGSKTYTMTTGGILRP